MSIQFKHREECLLRHFYVANLLHPLFALLLLFKQLSLSADVATIALGSHILTYTFNGFSRHNLGTDSSLNSDVKLLPWNEFLEFFAHSSAEGNGIVLMGECRKSVHRFTIEQDIEFGKFGRSETIYMIIKLSISFGDTLQFVVEVNDDLAKRYHEM